MTINLILPAVAALAFVLYTGCVTLIFKKEVVDSCCNSLGAVFSILNSSNFLRRTIWFLD
jgi:hypothetical protein